MCVNEKEGECLCYIRRYLNKHLGRTVFPLISRHACNVSLDEEKKGYLLKMTNYAEVSNMTRVFLDNRSTVCHKRDGDMEGNFKSGKGI